MQAKFSEVQRFRASSTSSAIPFPVRPEPIYVSSRGRSTLIFDSDSRCGASEFDSGSLPNSQINWKERAIDEKGNTHRCQDVSASHRSEIRRQRKNWRRTRTVPDVGHALSHEVVEAAATTDYSRRKPPSLWRRWQGDYHRDCWDTGEELYGKLPLIGGAVRFR